MANTGFGWADSRGGGLNKAITPDGIYKVVREYSVLLGPAGIHRRTRPRGSSGRTRARANTPRLFLTTPTGRLTAARDRAARLKSRASTRAFLENAETFDQYHHL